MKAAPLKSALAATALLGLGACVTGPNDAPQTAIAPAAPAAVRPVGRAAPSERSAEIRRYLARLEQDLSSQGLLRTDGGGPDTPFDTETLVRNFRVIALANEYVRGEGFRPAGEELGPVKKWIKPVRIAAEFGASVDPEARAKRSAELAAYVARLARITGHPISFVTSAPNFVVMFVGEDDQSILKPRVQQLVPDANLRALRIFDRIPRAVHCLVIAFSEKPGGYDYGNAVAYIRAEHTDLLTEACIHEEVAQGLGLGNDSPSARPSIFNDDEEFALLTAQDELLLKILYNPRLTPGMDAETATPIIRDIAASLMGGPS